jgi:predicted RNA polymerase sigma factor
MLERLGRTEEAAHAYDRAAALARTDAEASFLSRRGSELNAGVRRRGEAAAKRQ